MRIGAILLLFAPAVFAEASDNWPEYRGPFGNGHADARGLPVEWAEGKHVRWKTAIHDKGWSSPVIWGSQIWMTTARADGKELFAVCVDRESGKVVHDVRIFTTEKPAFCHSFNSYASCTPVVEEGRVYAHFGSAGSACLDTTAGKILWERRDLPCDHFRGPGSSPILAGNLLILIFDGYDKQYVAALDKATGHTVWKKDRNIAFPSDNGDMRKAYATPVVIEVGGKQLLVCPSAEATMAYDPKTGEEVWRVRHGGMNVGSRPLFGHGKLFLTTGDGGKQLFALRPDGSGDVTDTHIDWMYAKGVPTRPSLLLVGDFLYVINNNGIVSCLDARTGKREGNARLNGRFTASPIYAEGRIYFPDEDGMTHVVEAAPALKVLASNKLDAGCMASPAVAGNALFLRTKTHLYRLEKE